MVRQLQKAAQVFQQLSSGAQLLQNAPRKLPTSFRSGENILLSVRTLTGEVNATAYRPKTVSRLLHSMFPDEAAVHDTDPRDTAELSKRWDQRGSPALPALRILGIQLPKLASPQCLWTSFMPATGSL